MTEQTVEDLKGVKKVRVFFAKQRNGKTGMYPFRFREEDLEFEDVAAGWR